MRLLLDPSFASFASAFQGQLNESGVMPQFDVEIADEAGIVPHSIFVGGRRWRWSALSSFLAQEGAGLLIISACPDLGTGGLNRRLLDSGVSPKNMVFLGIRSFTGEDRTMLISSRMNTFPMHELAHSTPHDVCDAVMAAVRSWNALYVSIDLSVLDPAFCEGIERKEPGGMTTRELIYFIQRLRLLKNIQVWDVVGFLDVAALPTVRKLVLEAAQSL